MQVLVISADKFTSLFQRKHPSIHHQNDLAVLAAIHRYFDVIERRRNVQAKCRTNMFTHIISRRNYVVQKILM